MTGKTTFSLSCEHSGKHCRNMTSNLPISPNYSQLDENISENKTAKGQYIFLLILTLILSTETFITAFLLYDFSEDIQRTRETGKDGGYPIHCLSTDLTQPTNQAGFASCDLFNQELKQTAQQRLLMDIQNYVLETLGEECGCYEDLKVLYFGLAERGYPLCAGDGSHIPIIAPQEDAAAYYNRKGWHSIVLQAVVDHNFCFTDVYVGWPGRTHDARVLSNSPIFQMAEENGGYLFPHENSRIVNGVEVPVHLIGDAAYPLKKWLMKGFTNHQALTPQQRLYNYRLSSARMVVENAFGRLKGRWQHRTDV